MTLNLKNNLGLVCSLLCFRHLIKNKRKFYFSILIGNSNYKIKLKNDGILNFKSSQYDFMYKILTLIAMAASYSIKSRNRLEFSLDLKNKFTIPLDTLSYEEQNLLEILVQGTRYGANFVTKSEIDISDYRDKTFKILHDGTKKIIETSSGVKFYIDSIHPGNTIIETFLNKIHLINSHDDWNNKVIIDVGAECGDTPLYYASMGAKVYAFEPIKANFEAMIRNLSLNPKISEKIVPINAAIGKDGMLDFYQPPKNQNMSSSFVYNIHGKDARLTKIKGYSIGIAMKEFKINHVDLLKMDCKGCEFFLTEKELENVDKVKIEYTTSFSSHKLKDLLHILENAGFQYMIYRINPLNISRSNSQSGHVYGVKIKH